ncbi:MAG: hypothetical protein IH989_06510 [Planctomycetes bacterium]|nr:hypothetical protein [Planctomycetota bacterium]
MPIYRRDTDGTGRLDIQLGSRIIKSRPSKPGFLVPRSSDIVMAKDKDSEKAENNTTLVHSIYWLQALIHQGERVFHAWNQKEGQHYPPLTTRMMEEHFFLVACMKAQRWLKKLKKIVDDPQPIVAFLAVIEPCHVVRNKREHDDEYFGAGKKEEGEPMHDVDSDSPVKMTVGTSVSCQVDGKLLLGGICDVRKAMVAADSLQDMLRRLQHAYWDRKVGETEHFKMAKRLLGP